MLFKSIYIFGVPIFQATELPIIIEYLWNDGQQWYYEKETIEPFKVTYTNEIINPKNNIHWKILIHCMVLII